MDLKTATTFIAMTIPFFIMTIWMLVDVSMKRFKTPGEKAIWWLIVLIPFIGWFVYLLIGFRRGTKPAED